MENGSACVLYIQLTETDQKLLTSLGRECKLVKVGDTLEIDPMSFENGLNVDIWAEATSAGFLWRFRIADTDGHIKMAMFSDYPKQLAEFWQTIVLFASGVLYLKHTR